MLNFAILFLGIAVAGWLGMLAAERAVVTIHRPWRYSLQNMMVFTAVVSLILTLLVLFTRK